jgi:hypothetical protein
MRSFVLALALLLGESASQAATGQTFVAESRAENASQKRLSDAQIKRLLIAESIAAYEGNCPCPYSRARNGWRCGRRSAYSREGGAAPLCYPNDVTAEMVQAYREEHPEG